MSFSVCLSVCNTNHTKTMRSIATKLVTWTKFDLVVDMGYFISSVLAEVREGSSTKILYVNVYCVAPPGGGGRGYYKSAVEMTCTFALYTRLSAIALLTLARAQNAQMMSEGEEQCSTKFTEHHCV